MEKTLNKYRKPIQEGKINPLAHWDEKKSQVIFDPNDPSVPLDYMGLGTIVLSNHPATFETKEYEYAIVPINGEFEVSVDGNKIYEGSRPGGPFQTQPEFSNASAIYIGRNSAFSVKGDGQMVYFFAPAFDDRESRFIKPGEKKQMPRGKASWERYVITLVSTKETSTNLIVGETYSLPGLWSGTPAHLHDKDDIENGQSDMEEIYFHLARVTGGNWSAYGVQLLFDDKGLDKAYLVHNNDAFAIPGGAHPVVAGPVSDMLYIWGLASYKTTELKMLDVAEFTYLKSIEEIINKLETKYDQLDVSVEEIKKLADEYKLDNLQRQMLKLHLLEKGIKTK